MTNTIQPTVNYEQTGIWGRDLGPDNPLPEATQASEAQGLNHGFAPPVDQPATALAPNEPINQYDPALGNNVDMFA
ncbi:MAG: hypothetical protein ACOCW6_10640 [Spirochaetota bacterium]